MKKYLNKFLAVLNYMISFVVQNQFINGAIQKKIINLKGSREFWKLNSFPSQDGLVLQRLPLNFSFTMQNLKRKGVGAKNSSASSTADSRNEFQKDCLAFRKSIAPLKKKLAADYAALNAAKSALNAMLLLYGQQAINPSFKPGIS